MIRLTRLAPDGLGGELYAKLEMFNPGGSVKDRIGVSMIEAAEAEGRIEPGRTTVVEATSGNTGIALAFVCAAKGYDLILTLPQGMSREREGLLRLYGAQFHITESMGGMDEAVAAARALARDDDYWLPDQFSNPANPDDPPAHHRAGDLGRARRPRRLPRRGRGHRRDHHRSGRFPEGAQPVVPGRRGRARGLRRAVGRARRAPQDPGHRRGLRAAGARPLAGRRGHRASTTRTRSRPPARAPAARASWSASPAARPCGRRCRSRARGGPRPADRGRSLPDSGERYVSTPFFAPEPAAATRD